MLKGFIQKASLFALIFFILFFSLASDGLAHYPWIQLDSFHPEEGEKLELTIGFGHHFPSLASFLEHERIKNITIYNHQKQKYSMIASTKFNYKSKKGLQEGSYVVASFAPNFFTETTSGYKQRSKEGLNNVIECEHNNWCMKSIVNVGNSHEDVDIKMGHPIEIIPLKNPSTLDQGDSLPIQVVLKGEPQQKIKIQATYMGFTSDKQEFAQTVQTDENGRAEIELTHRGIWLVKAYSKAAYPNPDICDIKEYIASLTFRLK